MGSWKRQMLASMEREVALDAARGDPDYACYRPNLTKEEMKKVLDYSKKDDGQARLPKKEGLCAEIRRFDPTAQEKDLKNAKRDELIAMLYQAIGATPRKRTWAKKYHRFGLSFCYNGPFPTPMYRKGMDFNELKAMLELYPNPQITVSDIKNLLREYGTKLSGGKPELFQRLRDQVGAKDVYEGSYHSYTSVSCWEDEKMTLQAKFDAERDIWKAEVDVSKENRQNFEKAQKQREKRKAAKNDADEAQKKRRQEAATRRWSAKPYQCNNKKGSTKFDLIQAWKAKYPKLSFAYSGAEMPQPEDFSTILKDYLDAPHRHAHHMLAYLEQGHGGLQVFNTRVNHPYMSLAALARIHRQRCKLLSISHQYAIQKVQRDVQEWESYRLEHGI